jgi:hypothetical protein
VTIEGPTTTNPTEPTNLGEPTAEAPSTARRQRRRRRPSGAAPPLPRSIGTGTAWLVASAALLTWGIVIFNSPAARRATDRVDAAILRQFARLRTDWVTDIASPISRIGMGWAAPLTGAALLLALMVLKRWRHVFTLVGSLAVASIAVTFVYHRTTRPRPYDVTIIGTWRSFSFPDAPIAFLTFVVIGIAYGLVVAGRPRTIAKIVGTAVVAVFAASQLYLGTFHPFDILAGVAITTAIVLNAFRFFTPNEVFPVTYGGGKTAHLDVGGRRGEAVRQAVQDQLGLTVLDLKPVGLEGSGGSTPLRLRVEGDPDTYLFGKLYAMNHVRADRWYKLGRTILYGRLEDEAPFQSVRRLVEYEDYAARLLRDVGIPTATSYGIVEMTPEREYLLITEFFDGAQEIGDADIDDGVIDQGLKIVRQLWDAGLAHRDVKPANLLVHHGQVRVIDVFFVQVRPSPWRQAVDLANMMLVLAVRTDANRVYEHALRYFTPDEIAEAFAAARGVASPTQLRTAMKKDPRDLLGQFRELAPARRPISLQRWNVKRIALTFALVFGAYLTVNVVGGLFSPADYRETSGRVECGTSDEMILMAQAVPSATSVPCIASLPAGWKQGGVRIERGHAIFWLDSDRAGTDAVAVTLRPRGECHVTTADEVPSDEPGMRRFERPDQLPPHLRATRSYLFPGGCVTYRFDFDSAETASLLFDVDNALAFQSRADLVETVRARNGLRLCGAGAPRCPGGS